MINQLLKPILEAMPENNRLERIWKLAQVDFKKRYYNDYLGLMWALLNPIIQLVVYYFVFTELLLINLEHFALYMFMGLLFWMFFSESTSKSINILIEYRYLIENIQFNKIDLFFSSSLSVFMGFTFNLTAFFSICWLSGVPIYSTVLYFPLFIANLYILSFALCLLLSTINVYIKDVRHIWDMITTLGIWSAPVFYPEYLFREELGPLIHLNPFAGIIINAHNTVLYGRPPDFELCLSNFAFAITLLLICYFVFLRYSHKAIEKL